MTDTESKQHWADCALNHGGAECDMACGRDGEPFIAPEESDLVTPMRWFQSDLDQIAQGMPADVVAFLDRWHRVRAEKRAASERVRALLSTRSGAATEMLIEAMVLEQSAELAEARVVLDPAFENAFEVFVTAMRRARRGDPDDNPGPWAGYAALGGAALYAMAKNAFKKPVTP